jgi:hypothetical protein
VKQRTVRELGGEIAMEIMMRSLRGNKKLAHLNDDLEATSATIELVMRVLARHNGKVIKNDIDFPVVPLPQLKPIKKRARKAI